MDLRAKAWLRASGADTARAAAGEGFYAALLARAPSGPSELDSERQIELDLDRTFAEHPWLRTPPARDALRRVLVAAARAAPQHGYAQSMNYVAAFALLTFRADEESAFWVVRAALERLAPPQTYARDLEGLHVELRTLSTLLTAKVPRVAEKLASIGADTSLFATEWLLCLFTCTLPAETTARVWDAYLFEGAKVLVRVSIALLKMHEAALMRCDEVGAFIATLKTAAARTHDRDALMLLAFDGIGSLSGARLQRLRDAATLEVASERADVSARRGSIRPSTAPAR